MTTKLAELRKRAEAATPGPWEAIEPEYAMCVATAEGKTISTAIQVQDANYIAAANPQTILAMCDLLEQMREALELAADLLPPKSSSGCDCDMCKAIAAFDKFNGGER